VKNILVLTLALLLTLAAGGRVSALEDTPIAITILYDNYIFSQGLQTDWGFSCLIKGTEKTILFDTGTNSDILFHNINKLKVNPKDVELVVLSHIHRDHTGGLPAFLDENNNVTVYFPASFPDEFRSRVARAGAKVVAVDNPADVCKGVRSTGEMGVQIKEQSLILDTSKGLVVITGCAHPGIINIVKKAKEVVDKEIYLVCGGFHLLSKSEDEVKEIINEFKALGVVRVGPTHCTGDRAIELFKDAYKENFIQMGVGRVIRISD
jgi:7,8-dihydropterin-6-yl-methyl-4-(beta-D-ribofuranosyl)aminobenzene 5'-phosphate synthase